MKNHTKITLQVILCHENDMTALYLLVFEHLVDLFGCHWYSLREIENINFEHKDFDDLSCGCNESNNSNVLKIGDLVWFYDVFDACGSQRLKYITQFKCSIGGLALE